MQTKNQNKMLGDDSIENKDQGQKPVLQPYSFPDHGITVLAESLEDAQKKLSELIKNK